MHLLLAVLLIATAVKSDFESVDKANEWMDKWCKERKDAWTNYHDEGKTWSKEDPLWKMVSDDVEFCRMGDCFHGLQDIVDSYNGSGLLQLFIAKHLNCDMIMFGKTSLLLELIWNLQFNDGEEVVFKEYLMVYFDHNGLVKQAHHQHHQKFADQFREMLMDKMPKQEL